VRRAAALAALVLAACPAPRATLPPPRTLPALLAAGEHHDEPGLAGVVHVVGRGETVWRIARAYGIDAGDLMETNGIADARSVAVGTELFVPGASRVVEVSAAPADAETASAPAPAERATRPAVSPSPPPPGPARARPSGEPPLEWPLQGVLYGRYGVRAGKRHDGIDISAPEGTPVVAAAAGTVLHAGEQAGYGQIVILQHEGGLLTLYAHNSRLLVAQGERVRQGQPIARVGQTGRTSGPHLHFEVREGTRPKNPLLFLP
jgi:murein DD-endopeptidase MepM/ murein hydrolase activator NlpD